MTITEMGVIATAVLAIINIALTINLGQKNYKHLRQKDFQEMLYKSKVDVYQTLYRHSIQAYYSLDMGENEIIGDIGKIDKREWRDYYNQHIANIADEYLFAINTTLDKQGLLLPTDIIKQSRHFVYTCNIIVKELYHQDVLKHVVKHETLGDLLEELIKSYRNDLGVDFIDKELSNRLGNSKKSVKKFE